ncbi:MAG: hypothetical protein KIT58_16505 [Planctomycetota bacterium]|nr:hypothetical protein [Planctomycetota bacterium]
MSDELLPLVGDPARSAHDSLGGYDYQVWHSVRAWLEMSDHDLLFLEGAEDFDLVAKDGATATQVKRTAEKISLNTARAVDAIENFLTVCERNKDRRVSYRYLTTSVPAVEHGDPFGPGVPGICVWERYRTSLFPPIPDLAGAEAIARVLRAKASSQHPRLRDLTANSVGKALVLFRSDLG